MQERRASVGKRSQQRVAVGNRFVARDGQPAAQAAGGRDGGGGQRHIGRILRDLGDFPARLDITDEMVLIECRVTHT